jgi:hypothetical protein
MESVSFVYVEWKCLNLSDKRLMGVDVLFILVIKKMCFVNFTGFLHVLLLPLLYFNNAHCIVFTTDVDKGSVRAEYESL